MEHGVFLLSFTKRNDMIYTQIILLNDLCTKDAEGFYGRH